MKRRKRKVTSEREESSSTAKKRQRVRVYHDQQADEGEIQSAADGGEALDLQMLEATLMEIVAKRGSEKTC